MKTLNTTYASDDSIDGIYYRLYLDRDDLITVISLTNKDEFYYDKKNYIRNIDDVAYYFLTKEDAIKQMKNFYNDKYINSEFINN